MKKEELIIGKTYRVKSQEWFDANKNSDDKVVENGIEFKKLDAICLFGKSRTLLDFCDKGYYHENDVEIGYKGEDGWWKHEYFPPFILEEDPNDTRVASAETLELIKKIKEEKFIYGYDGGPGGGRGGPINTETEMITPAFNHLGEEGVYIKVSGLKRIFTLDKIRELFLKGETEQSFKATEYTTIRTELKLIKDKTKLPPRSSWSTMRD